MFSSLIFSILTIKFVQSANLREILGRIKFGDNEGPLLARIETKIPKYSDIFCEPKQGRIG